MTVDEFCRSVIALQLSLVYRLSIQPDFMYILISLLWNA